MLDFYDFSSSSRNYYDFLPPIEYLFLTFDTLGTTNGLLSMSLNLRWGYYFASSFWWPHFLSFDAKIGPNFFSAEKLRFTDFLMNKIQNIFGSPFFWIIFAKERKKICNLIRFKAEILFPLSDPVKTLNEQNRLMHKRWQFFCPKSWARNCCVGTTWNTIKDMKIFQER